jgi:hypothetical protein
MYVGLIGPADMDAAGTWDNRQGSPCRHPRGIPLKRTIVLCCLSALAVAGLVPAYGAVSSLITGNQIKNHTITGADIKKGSLPLSALNKATRKKINSRGVGSPTLPGAQGGNGQNGQNGTQGPQGLQGSAGAVSVGPHWGPIDRNIIGSPEEDLRNGPFVPGTTIGKPPFGDGSLHFAVGNISTAGNTEKAAFGNEVDFQGKPVDQLTNVGFQVYTTGENTGKGNPNMPSITIEIDPNLTATPSNFSSLVFVPSANSPSNQWSPYIDATDGAQGTWFLTGAAGTATGCNISTPCSFAGVQSALNDGGASGPATIYTVAVSKGRDFEWQGAIDGLRINNEVFDFELFGVVTRSAT